MLRGNLSTRPFYNERLATIAVWGIAAVAVVLTVFNATQLVRLASQRRDATTRIERDRNEAARLRAQDANGQQRIDRALLARLAASTREANDLIDQRTFSWTAFFGLLEKTLPFDARVVMVSPRVEKGTFRVSMTVIARSLQDVATFVDALRGTGAFYDAAAIEQTRRDDGTYNATVEATYLAPGTAQRLATSSSTAAAPPVTAPPVTAPARAPR